MQVTQTGGFGNTLHELCTTSDVVNNHRNKIRLKNLATATSSNDNA